MPLPESTAVAAEPRTAMGKLTRRVKLEDQMPLGQVAVLGALDRSGAMTTSELAADQRVRPQSMARAIEAELTGEERELLARGIGLVERLAAHQVPPAERTDAPSAGTAGR
ncbi:hypothetical protein [Streptomyces sp. NPDC016675]|uniref:hypothetical protein n=1 Tax=Streptomyces sp. NPDC016675 TaxID=3364970 RepID=UPI0036FDF0F4